MPAPLRNGTAVLEAVTVAFFVGCRHAFASWVASALWRGLLSDPTPHRAKVYCPLYMQGALICLQSRGDRVPADKPEVARVLADRRAIVMLDVRQRNTNNATRFLL